MLLFLTLSHAISKSLSYRGDSLPSLNIAHIEQWAGLTRNPFSFKSGKHLLRGYKYKSSLVSTPKAVILLFHGISTGHFGYMNFIARFAKKGYLVYAFDERGSLLSEGSTIGNLAEAAKAQKPFFEFLDKETDIVGLPIYSVGHSWGGYASLCTLRFPQVSKVVSIAGFDSPNAIYKDTSPIVKFFAWETWLYQWFHYGKNGNVSGLKLMKETDKPVLYMQGDQDKVVNFNTSGKKFREVLKDKPNISFYIKEGAGHNPYWTKEVEKYYSSLLHDPETVSSYNRDLDRKIDYDKLFSLDEEFMKRIIDFLEV